MTFGLATAFGLQLINLQVERTYKVKIVKSISSTLSTTGVFASHK